MVNMREIFNKFTALIIFIDDFSLFKKPVIFNKDVWEFHMLK